jgi:hypothetical protein
MLGKLCLERLDKYIQQPVWISARRRPLSHYMQIKSGQENDYAPFWDCILQ